MENSMKVKNTVLYDLAVPFLHIFPKDMRSVSHRYLHSCACCSTIHDSQDKELAQVSITRFMDIENMLCMHKGILFIQC
jgi:hypothetical protein